MHRKLYFDLIDQNKGHFDPVDCNPGRALASLGTKLGVDHVAYLGVNLPKSVWCSASGASNDAFVVATYSDEWVSRYISQSYVDIDPVIRSGFRGIMPVDWSDLPGRDDKKVVKLFGEACEHGVGMQGLSIPIRGVHGEVAMFSINSRLPRKEWLDFRKEILQELQIIAYQFHTSVLELKGVTPPVSIALSARERECLKWAAAGKSAWETSEIIGVSERTVSFFLEQSRVKLDATNKVQAVAKAIRLSLI